MNSLLIVNILFIITICLVSGGFFTYVYFCIIFYRGFKHLKQEINYKKKTVSVLIAAHNEGKNLAQLLTCLHNQSYPQNLYEVIIADDDSEDNTEEIITLYQKLMPNLRYHRVTNRLEVLSPKKNALEQIISLSSGEIILTTDADCIVPYHWISSMVEHFADDVSVVAGYSRTKLDDWDHAKLLHKYEHFDFALTYTVLGGGYTVGRSFACIGQNLGYTRKAYESVGGFSKIKKLLSGDDVNLMQLIRLSGQKVVFNFDYKSFVYTKPIESWKQLINQRSRWASNLKHQFRLNREFFFILVSMAFMYWGVIILILFNWKLALVLLMVRIIIENIFLYNVIHYFDLQRKQMRFYPIWFIIQTFFLVFTMVLGQFNIFVWHGKKQTVRVKM